MSKHYDVVGDHAESLSRLSLLIGEPAMRRVLKDLARMRVGVDERLGGAFADREGVHLIIDGKPRLLFPWTGVNLTLSQ